MEVVRELEENDLPFAQVQRKYGVTGCGTVQTWAQVWEWIERKGDTSVSGRVTSSPGLDLFECQLHAKANVGE